MPANECFPVPHPEETAQFARPSLGTARRGPTPSDSRGLSAASMTGLSESVTDRLLVAAAECLAYVAALRDRLAGVEFTFQSFVPPVARLPVFRQARDNAQDLSDSQ